MKLPEIKAFIESEAVTQGLYGYVIDKLNQNNQWDDLDALCEIYGISDNEDLAEFIQSNNYFRHSDITDPLTVKTRFEWYASKKGFNEYCLPYSQVSERLYNYFLEILPPNYMPYGFMVSEPYDYDHTVGQSTYAAFCRVRGNCYFLGNIAPKNYETVLAKLEQML